MIYYLRNLFYSHKAFGDSEKRCMAFKDRNEKNCYCSENLCNNNASPFKGGNHDDGPCKGGSFFYQSFRLAIYWRLSISLSAEEKLWYFAKVENIECWIILINHNLFFRPCAVRLYIPQLYVSLYGLETSLHNLSWGKSGAGKMYSIVQTAVHV